MESNYKDIDRLEKLSRLRTMRILATGLLVLMAFTYIIFKRFENHNLLFSSIVAFSEAAMIGALADWFAVTALFRHPLGMTWIPHTAIIQKNKDKIGNSLSNFVVSNFFTGEAIKGKLINIDFSENIMIYYNERKTLISEKIAANLPDILKMFLSNDKLAELVNTDLKSKLREIEIYSYIDKVLFALVSAELHVPVIKQLMGGTYKWVSENKEKTLKIIEGMNKTFTLPMVGDIIYNFILRTLSKLIEDMENGVSTEFNREILNNMPSKLVSDFKSSEGLREKVEKLKNDILDSDVFNNFVDEKISSIKETLVSYTTNSRDEVSCRLVEILDALFNDLMNNSSVRENFDSWIKDSLVDIICKYRQDISALISDTVKEWPVEDMVEKLEVQVGGDLQYIRINGTIIGGLAGLAIHLISKVF